MNYIGKACLYPGTPKEVWGICTIQDITPNPTIKEYTDEEGEVAMIVITNAKAKKFTGTWVPLAGATNSPVDKEDLIGQLMPFNVYDGKVMTVVVTNAPFKRKAGDNSEFSIEGSYYPAICGEITSGGSGGTSNNPVG